MHNLGHRLGLYLAPLLAAVSIGIAAPVALGEEKPSPPADAKPTAAVSADAIPADQLEQLVAPIALYPDALIAQILMASTYPLDVVQADRWLEDQEGLEGEALQKAVDPEPWDDSVKALVFFPSVLGFMSDNLDWTQDLGDAVLAQQGELTDTIQRLRGEADKAGALKTNEQQRVEKAGDTIIIQPAKPEVVYVPTYDPVKVYGQEAPPATQYYPDAYADASASYDAGYAAGQAAGESATASVPSGTVVPAETVYPGTTSVVTTADDSTDEWLSFGVGALAGGLLTAAIMWDDNDNWNDRLYYGGPGYYGGAGYWGGANYWNNNGWREPANINVDRSRDIQRNVERGDVTVNRGIVGNEVKRWEHNPERRGGVRYRDASTENRFAARRQEGSIDREAARGRLGQGDRALKAPDLGTVRREGAATGGTSRLAEARDAGGRVGDRQGPVGDRQVRAPDRDLARDQARDQVRRDGAGGGRAEGVREQRPGGGEARAKAQARAPAAKAKPRAQPAAATKRPVNREAARPATSQVKRPERAASRPQAQRPQAQRPQATRASAPRSSAFQQASRPSTARAASNRGGASRASASAGGRGGGGGRAGGGGRGGGRR